MAVVDFWNYSGFLVAAGTLLMFFGIAATIWRLDFFELERNSAALAFIALSTAFALIAIYMRHPSLDACKFSAQQALGELGQDARLNPSAYELDGNQTELAGNMQLACYLQAPRDFATLPSELFKAQQAPEVSVATRLMDGAEARPLNECIRAYEKLYAVKPSLFDSKKAELSCLINKPSRLSW